MLYLVGMLARVVMILMPTGRGDMPLLCFNPMPTGWVPTWRVRVQRRSLGAWLSASPSGARPAVSRQLLRNKPGFQAGWVRFSAPLPGPAPAVGKGKTAGPEVQSATTTNMRCSRVPIIHTRQGSTPAYPGAASSGLTLTSA